MVDLKELRIEKKMTQQEVADLIGISLRSYKSYENDETLSTKLAKEESTIYTIIYLVVEQEVGLSSAPKSTPPTGFDSVCNMPHSPTRGLKRINFKARGSPLSSA